MSHVLTASQRSALIRLAASQPQGSDERRVLTRLAAQTVKAALTHNKIVGANWRLSWSRDFYKLEELPQKGKRRLIVAEMDSCVRYNDWIPRGLPVHSPFLPENILQDASIKASDSFDAVFAKLPAAIRSAAERVVELGADINMFSHPLKAKWSEEAVSALTVTPENVDPFTVSGKDFTVTVEWTTFKAYSPKSDMQQSDPHYSYYESSAPASARKLYKILKADPTVLRNVKYVDFRDWLRGMQINASWHSSVWH